MKKILVIGCGGAGKTTFSKQLGSMLGIPALHLDAYFWKPGWEPTESLAWQQKTNELIAQPAWIMDGNYGSTLESRIAACDSICFLDMPRWRCIINVVIRRLKYAGTHRPEMVSGNKERLNWAFLHWIWTYRKKKKPRIMELLNKNADKKVVIFRSYKEVDAFLAHLNR